MVIPQRTDSAALDAHGEDSPVDTTALRMLNLLFMLHTAPAPLSTAQIISSAEAGYGSDNRDSDVRKFARDRKRLAELGILVREVTTEGASEREESRWEIDRPRTHARADVLEREDIEAVLSAIDEHFSLYGDDPARWPLQRARTKLQELSCEALGLEQTGRLEENMAMRHIWSAYRRRKAARFTYKHGDRPASDREVEVYAIFPQGSHVYVVGRCCETDQMRTFRTDRIVSARKTPDSAPTYAVPADFASGAYHFLPFDFSSADPVTARFSFPAEMDEHELMLLTRNRGTLTHAESSSVWTWEVEVRDLRAAAVYALAHASRGMRFIAPAELVACKNDLIREAVTAHGA